jgi:hypothetical protein
MSETIRHRHAVRFAVLLLVLAGVGLGLPAPHAAAVDDVRTPPSTVMRTVQGLQAASPSAAAKLRGARSVRSRAFEAPIPFTMVGFDVPDGARLRYRTSEDATSWSPWRDAPTYAQAGDAPAPADGGPAWASSTEPEWVGEARWVQVDVDGGSPADVAVSVMDTMGRSRSLKARASDALSSLWQERPTGAVAHAVVPQPKMTSRSRWGAGASRTPRYSSSVRAATLHHTAGSNTYACKDAPGIVRAIWNYHAKKLGWGDIGYHFLVDKCGRIYEGRAGGIKRAVLGAHAGGFNTSTFGISIMGDFTRTLPPPAAREAVAQTVAWKFSIHRINPTGRVTLTSAGSTRYKKGVRVTLPTFFVHRDVSKTTCPGDRLMREVPAIRRRVASLVATHGMAPLPPEWQPAPTPTPTPVASQPPAPPGLLFAASPDEPGLPLHGSALAPGIFHVRTDWSDEGDVTERVEFRLNTTPARAPTVVSEDKPYTYGWLDTEALGAGMHSLSVTVVLKDGTRLFEGNLFEVRGPP